MRFFGSQWTALAVPLALAIVFWLVFRRRAQLFGYPSTAAYLRAAPRSDAEKRDAVDLTLKGLVCLFVAVFSLFLSPFFLPVILFAPLLMLATLIPLFYGTRKLVYAWLGLGLIDDADRPPA